MDVWPIHLLTPNAPHWVLAGALTGATPVVGPPSQMNLTGGPYWTCEHGETTAYDPEMIKVARSLQALADGGSTRFIVTSCEGGLMPSPAGATTVPHSDGTPFSDGQEYISATFSAVVQAPAALRATTLQIALPVGTAMDVCDFSIDHPTKGPRRYRAARVLDQVGSIATVTIRPPLREALTGGEEIEFEHPRCVMVLVNAQDFLGALQSGRIAELSARFVEAP